MRRLIVVQKKPGPIFLKLNTNAMKLSDSLFFRHKFVMNGTLA
jgi:hypothetical protein